MELLNSEVSLESFFERLATADERVLMLDYDGTLAPFREKRDEAVPYPGVRQRLKKLITSDAVRLIIISGRRVRDIGPLLGLDPLPEIWGSHGAERLISDDDYRLVDLGEKVQEGFDKIDNWAERENLTAVLEVKPAGRAFHWRGFPEAQKERIEHNVRGYWEHRAEDYELNLHHFDGGLELKAASVNKGNATKSILSELTSNAAIAYLGDDRTDEDAFRALNSHGLRVLVRPEKRETDADIWLRPPEELIDFLDRWVRLVE
jgi:trehalose-phosphatase